MIGSRTLIELIGFLVLGAVLGIAIASVFIRILEEISDFVTIHRQAHVRHLVSEFEKLLPRVLAERDSAECDKTEPLAKLNGKDADPA